MAALTAVTAALMPALSVILLGVLRCLGMVLGSASASWSCSPFSPLHARMAALIGIALIVLRRSMVSRSVSALCGCASFSQALAVVVDGLRRSLILGNQDVVTCCVLLVGAQMAALVVASSIASRHEFRSAVSADGACLRPPGHSHAGLSQRSTDCSTEGDVRPAVLMRPGVFDVVTKTREVISVGVVRLQGLKTVGKCQTWCLQRLLGLLGGGSRAPPFESRDVSGCSGRRCSVLACPPHVQHIIFALMNTG